MTAPAELDTFHPFPIRISETRLLDRKITEQIETLTYRNGQRGKGRGNPHTQTRRHCRVMAPDDGVVLATVRAYLH